MNIETLSDIHTIEWEVTTRCNASCPQCPRNANGGLVVADLPLVDVSFEQAKRSLPLLLLTKLQTVYFCGTYGDPCNNKELPLICEWLKSHNINVVIHTNGSVQNHAWWKRLAGVLSSDDFVVFSIDGLADTNHIYRRGTSFDKIMNNARTFMSNGGRAHWDFIVFEHNEHQVGEARHRAVDEGFTSFNFKKTSRFIDKHFNKVDKWPIQEASGDVVGYLKLPTNPKYVNDQLDKYQIIASEYGNFNNYTRTTDITCYHDKVNKIFISAEGYVFPCGWVYDRQYGSAATHSDNAALTALFNMAGGKENANIYHNTLHNVISTDWFPVLAASWNNDTRLSRCGMMCGDAFNAIGVQNESVGYWDAIDQK